MPTHGKATSIILGGYNVSQWFSSMSTTETQEVGETTGFQDLDKTYVIGASDAKVSGSGRYEGDLGQIRNIVYTQIQAQGTCVISVGWGVGIKAGNPVEFGVEEFTSWTITSPVGGIVTTGLDGSLTGGLGHGKHLFDLAAAKSATFTGTTQQLDAAVPSGSQWAAVFHRLQGTGTAVSVLKIQTSADGSTWVDLPGATVTFGSGVATASQLVSGTANTAGPYVRAVETITGTGTSQTLAAFGLY